MSGKAEGGRVEVIETLDQAAAWLEGLINVERDPRIPYRRLGLGPIQALLDRLDRPDRGVEILHVAGSKGKGSTCLLAEALLGELGLRVGTFTSPHLVRWTERFRTDGVEVDGERLARAVERVRPHVEALQGDPATAPTFFDATTAAGLVLFAEAGVDRVVLEVGLGGRLDSTNAVTPVATAVTSIELEHTDRLGHTRAAIAGEKAGILKPGVPCIVGDLSPDALEVVEARAREVGAPTLVHGRAWSVTDALASTGRRVAVEFASGDGASPTVGCDFGLGPPGRHQAHNAGLALAMVRAAEPGRSLRELAAAADRAWSGLVLPGRLEVVGQAPLRIVDAAHTGASAQELARFLDRVAPKGAILVLSISADKDVDAVLQPLLERATAVVTTRAEPVRSLDPVVLAERIRSRLPGLTVQVEPVVANACRWALARASEADVVCAAGSVYLAGAARAPLAETDQPV